MKHDKFEIVELIRSGKIWTGSEIISVLTGSNESWSELLEINSDNDSPVIILFNRYIRQAEQAVNSWHKLTKKHPKTTWKSDVITSSQWFTGSKLIVVPSPFFASSWFDAVGLALTVAEENEQTQINHLFEIFLTQIY